MGRSRWYSRAGHRTRGRTWRATGCPAGTQDTSCRSLPAAGSAKGRNRGPRLTARDSHGQEHGHRHRFSSQDVSARGSHTGSRPLPAVNRVDALTAGSEQGLESVSGLESFPLRYTAGRQEGARRKAKVEFMTAALEEGLVTTIRHALGVLKRFSAPAGGRRRLWWSDMPIWALTTCELPLSGWPSSSHPAEPARKPPLILPWVTASGGKDRKSTRLNSSQLGI